MDVSAVLNELREIEARIAVGHCGAGAAAEPAKALRKLLSEARARGDDEGELTYSLVAPTALKTFVMLCQRYEFKLYRRPRQRKTTITISGPRSFLYDVFRPLFEAVARAIEAPINQWVGQLLDQFNDEVGEPPSGS